MPRPLVRLSVIAGGTVFVLWSIYRVAKAVANRQIDEFMALLKWLACRDSRLESYDPPENVMPTAGASLDNAPKVDALVVHGCSMVAVPHAAADLFVDVLHPAGCRTVLLTGGVGRETPPLWGELRSRGLTGLVGHPTPWAHGTLPASIDLPLQGKIKPVLHEVDLKMAPEKLRTYCSEADVFLELFAARCAARGVVVVYGGNPMASDDWSVVGSGDAPRVYLENASTHTGTNVAYSLVSLEKLGLGQSPTLAVVQQPQLHRRTCLTWHKQSGVMPVGWTVRPTLGGAGRSIAEQLQYAIGEFKRIPAYSAADKNFCSADESFPHEAAARLIAMEDAISASVELEEKQNAGAGA